VQVPFGGHPATIQIDQRRSFFAEPFTSLKLKRFDFAVGS
jgi:hypothetical protein